ncbi:MAG: AAA family ATPase [Bacteroidales bacterium]|nr:AAA family ATPase [Bacteroidales bacterium]
MLVPLPPRKYEHLKINSINKSKIEDLFVFLVRRLMFSGHHKEYLTHNQISYLVFNEKDSAHIKHIRNHYDTYFEYQGRKKRLNIEKVYEEHPHIWDLSTKKSTGFDIKDLIEAVNDEIKETKLNQAKKYIEIGQIVYISSLGNIHIYSAKIYLEEDTQINLVEGSQIRMINKDRQPYYITILDFNLKEEIISFQINSLINCSNARVQVMNLGILYKLKEKLENLEKNDFPIWKLVNNVDFPNKLNFQMDIWDQGLDATQKDALVNALNNDISYIWGPPGTGKSHTLARLLLNLYNSGEKTVVCATANIAVDGLLEKTIDLLRNEYFPKSNIDVLKERKIIRLGYSQSDAIRDTKEIKFENENLSYLSYEIQRCTSEINNLKESANNDSSAKILELKSKRDNLKRAYEKASKSLLLDSNLIFLTASKLLFEDILQNIDIHNIVIDEGSMMSLPSLLSISTNIKRRIIISGDFKQLGPIAISKSSHAKKWLHKDLFSILGDDDNIIQHKSVSMLKHQRRSAAMIADLINEPFYQGLLQTIESQKHYNAIGLPPSNGNIAFIQLDETNNNKVSYSKSKSKYNSLSRKVVMDLVKKIISTNPEITSIGIISPYRQQVIDYKKDLENLPSKLYEIKAGTIHTFQGSEADIIIWDITDAMNDSIGTLYRENTGERIVNVAISRAISKLIIVGNKRLFNECKGRDSVSFRIKQIISKAYNESIND